MNLSLSIPIAFIFSIKWWLLAWVLLTYDFWKSYLVFAAYENAVAAGRVIPKKTKALLGISIAVGMVQDFFYNITLGSLLFLELPKTLMLTQRCDSHLNDGLIAVGTTIVTDPNASALVKWRGYVARYICANLLDPFEQGGHCHATKITNSSA